MCTTFHKHTTCCSEYTFGSRLIRNENGKHGGQPLSLTIPGELCTKTNGDCIPNQGLWDIHICITPDIRDLQLVDILQLYWI